MSELLKYTNSIDPEIKNIILKVRDRGIDDKPLLYLVQKNIDYVVDLIHSKEYSEEEIIDILYMKFSLPLPSQKKHTW